MALFVRSGLPLGCSINDDYLNRLRPSCTGAGVTSPSVKSILSSTIDAYNGDDLMAEKQVVGRRSTTVPRRDFQFLVLVQQFADFAFHGMIQAHRGAFTLQGMTLIFGNDGYEGDEGELCSQREVELFREVLAEEKIKEIAFATSGGGYTWAMVLEGEHDWVYDVIASCWLQACDELRGDDWTPVAS